MNGEIDYESLYHAIIDQIDESLQSKYDFDAILRTAAICWDGTAVQVKAADFIMVFDIISYEILEYNGYDLGD